MRIRIVLIALLLVGVALGTVAASMVPSYCLAYSSTTVVDLGYDPVLDGLVAHGSLGCSGPTTGTPCQWFVTFVIEHASGGTPILVECYQGGPLPCARIARDTILDIFDLDWLGSGHYLAYAYLYRGRCSDQANALYLGSGSCLFTLP